MGLSAALDEYMRNMVSYSLGSSHLPFEFLMEKLQQTEERRRGLESQVVRLQNEILDLGRRLDLSKEEAAMSARALKQQVSEKERLEAIARQAADRCAWLEEECLLYSKDRDVFMAAAEEAEERCTEAQEQMSAALESIQKVQEENSGEIARLGSQIQRLEAENALLRKEVSDSEERTRQRSEAEKDASLQRSSVTTTTTTAAGSDVVSLENGSMHRTGEECNICKQQSAVIPQLMSEIQRLWTEITIYKKNQARAEAQIRILTDENRDLKASSSGRRNASSTTTSPSPAAKKGKIMIDKSQKHCHNQIRHPLQSLDSNVINSRWGEID